MPESESTPIIEEKREPVEDKVKPVQNRAGHLLPYRERLIHTFDNDEDKEKVVRSMTKEALSKVFREKKNTAIFELLAKHELLKPENPHEIDVRVVIESIIQNDRIAQLVSSESHGLPDGVTVGFDDQGNLVIEKIIEAKYSNKAAMEGRNRKQPERTLATIKKAVEIINKIIDNPAITVQDLFPGQPVSRAQESILAGLQQRVNAIRLKRGKHITFSDELIYETIVPHDEIHPAKERRKIRKISETEVDIWVTHSIFSVEDIDKLQKEQLVEKPHKEKKKKNKRKSAKGKTRDGPKKVI